MRLIINDTDFRRLSPRTQRELIESLRGRPPSAPRNSSRKSYRWEHPIDLDDDLVTKLMHGLAENHRRRLELFARHGARVSMKKILAVTRDHDVRVLSYFQGAVTRKLRRLLDDPDRLVHLIGWDYESTKWDKDHRTIVDGICYVTPKTAQSLRRYFDMA